MFHIFKLPTLQMLAQRQLDEAERQHLEHSAAAEHHQALADMYAQRASRLEDVLRPYIMKIHGE